jgi:hypothetical protein
MDKLPLTLIKNGLYYEQVKRTDKVALYALRFALGGTIIGYETFLIKIDKALKKFGREYPEREHFPSNEEFGKIGWAWVSREKAESDFDGLCRANPPNIEKMAGRALE